jgi:large subunit ribosomal protein L35
MLPQAPLTKYSLNVAAAASSKSAAPTSKKIEVPVVKDEERLGFSVREFIKEYGLQPENGGGAFMWREVWDGTVSKVYQEILGTCDCFLLC